MKARCLSGLPRSSLGSLTILFFATLTSPLLAQDVSYRYGHLSRVDGELTLQRASEPETEAGAVNVPVMPGDRLWTTGRSRAEVTFADGTRVRLDERTKLDVVAVEGELLIQLWSGSVIVAVEEPDARVRIDTPAGSVFPSEPGLYRIDLDVERLALSVTRGSAELATGESSVIVRTGEMSETHAGVPARPYPFNTARLDDFDRFSAEIDAGYRTSREVIVRSLPHEVHHYVRELHHHGSWYQEPDYGWVWYPYAGVSWAPYRDGRWKYTRFGYTWISYEPWGWAPYHYGRWGYGHRGWYWIPGDRFGAAWVSFAFGPSWIGWSPLGFHGRAVFGFDSVFYPEKRYRGGRAVPRHVYDSGAGWNFVGRQQFNAGAGARLRASHVRASAGRARFVDSGTALGQDFRPRDVSPFRASGIVRGERAVERTTSGSSRGAVVSDGVASRFRSASSRARGSRAGSRTTVRDNRGDDSERTPSGVTRGTRSSSSSSPPVPANRSAWRERSERVGASRGRESTSRPATREGRVDRGRVERRGSTSVERNSGNASTGRVDRRGSTSGRGSRSTPSLRSPSRPPSSVGRAPSSPSSRSRGSSPRVGTPSRPPSTGRVERGSSSRGRGPSLSPSRSDSGRGRSGAVSRSGRSGPGPAVAGSGGGSSRAGKARRKKN